MRPEESLYPADWLRVAEKDLERVGNQLNVNDPGAAAIYLQQAVEKFLKAFLLSRGWKLKRTHDLEALLNAALAHDPSLEPHRSACQEITRFYQLERYPFVAAANLTEADVRDSLDQVKGLIEKLRTGLAGR